MKTRTKFQLQEIRNHFGSDAKTFIFCTMYDTNIPEDKRFFDATPWGTIEVQVNNPKVLEEMTLGKYFYVDFSAIEE